MKKTISLFLATLLCLTVFLTGCGGSAGDAVMTYGDSVITENVFRYYLSYYKNIYLKTYNDMKDTAAYYDTVMPDGRTAEQVLFDMTIENVQMTLVCMELFQKEGLSISEALREDIDYYLADLVTEYAGGDKKSLNAELAQYGVNLDMLADIYVDQEKSGFLFDYYYGEGGVVGLTDEEKDAWYRDNYSHVVHLYINDAYYYPVNEAGFTQTDENGNPISAPLTEEMQAEKQMTIDAIDASLAAGSDFIDVYNTFSEDKYYQNGYYLTRATNFVPEVVDAAFTLDEGEWTKLTSSQGTHYVLRLALDDKAWEDEANADFFASFETDLSSDKFMTAIREHLPQVWVAREALSKYSVEESPVNYRF